MVTSDVPGSSAGPRERKASAPKRAIIATWARVSALWIRAGAFPRRRGLPLSGRNDGRDRPDSTHRTNADSSPATKRSGGRTNCSATGAQPAAPRSARACAAAAATCSRPAGTQTHTCAAPVADARSCAPSSTRCGERSMRSLSLSLAGSPSMAFTRTVPPRPAPRASGHLDCGGKPCAAPSGQSGRLDGVLTNDSLHWGPGEVGTGRGPREPTCAGEIGGVAEDPVALRRRRQPG